MMFTHRPVSLWDLLSLQAGEQKRNRCDTSVENLRLLDYCVASLDDYFHWMDGQCILPSTFLNALTHERSGHSGF
jgi:hypothetical protein